MIKKIKRLFVRLALIAYGFIAILTIGAFMAPYIEVSTFPLLQLTPIGLGASFIIHLLALLIFLRSSRIGAALATGLLICSSVGIWENVKTNTSTYEGADEDLKVFSFNVEHFHNRRSRIDSIVQMIKPYQPDIVCMQEFRKHRIDGPVFSDSLISRELKLPYYHGIEVDYYASAPGFFSRYPILKIDTIFMGVNRVNSAVLYTLDAPKGTIGVLNVHMTSFMIANILKKHKDWETRLKAIYRRANFTLKDQDQKADILAGVIDDYPYPMIVAGDMNAVAHTRMLSKVNNRYNNTFTHAQNVRSNLGLTFPIYKPLGIRIDHQWASKEWHIMYHDVVENELSDHYAISVSYQLP